MVKKQANELTVLVIVNNLFKWSENFITRELVELRRQGVNLSIGARQIFERSDLSEAEKQLCNLIVNIPENPFTPTCLFRHVTFKIKNLSSYISALRAFFKMGLRPGKIGRRIVCLFRAAALAEKVKGSNFNLIHAHFLNAPCDTALFLSKLTDIPYGGTGHAKDLYRDNSGLKTKLGEAAYITTCTEANFQFLRQLGSSDSSKIYKVYHGISSLNLKRNRPFEDPFTFVAVGRLIKKKGFEYLIEACNLLKKQDVQFRCHLVGTGPLEEPIKFQISSRGLAQEVKMLGYVPPNLMAAVYEEADALVMPSIIDDEGDKDGLPNVCLEAMHHGLPIVGSNISGIPEGVVHNQNGLLVPPGDAEKLSEAMLKLIRISDLTKMKKASQKIARQKFSLEKNVGELKRVMEQNYRN